MSQNSYQVLSIYKVPNYDYNLIRIKRVWGCNKKEFALLSPILSQISIENNIGLGDTILIKINLLDQNPFEEFVTEVRGEQILFIDGQKVFDPNEKLYYSPCLKGLRVIKDCKVE